MRLKLLKNATDETKAKALTLFGFGCVLGSYSSPKAVESKQDLDKIYSNIIGGWLKGEPLKPGVSYDSVMEGMMPMVIAAVSPTANQKTPFLNQWDAMQWGFGDGPKSNQFRGLIAQSRSLSDFFFAQKSQNKQLEEDFNNSYLFSMRVDKDKTFVTLSNLPPAAHENLIRIVAAVRGQLQV